MSHSLDEQFKRAMKATARKRSNIKMPIRLTQAQLDEMDRSVEDIKSGREKGIPLETVLRENL